jgi:hypothetical protein
MYKCQVEDPITLSGLNPTRLEYLSMKYVKTSSEAVVEGLAESLRTLTSSDNSKGLKVCEIFPMNADIKKHIKPLLDRI